MTDASVHGLSTEVFHRAIEMVLTSWATCKLNSFPGQLQALCWFCRNV